MFLLDPYFLGHRGQLKEAGVGVASACPCPETTFPRFSSSRTTNLKLPLSCLKIITTTVSDYHSCRAFHPGTLCAVLGMAR